MAHHWIFDWLSENDVRTEEDIYRVLSEKPLFTSLKRAASQATVDRPTPIDDIDAIVAGRGLDLTGIGACANPACVAKTASSLLRRSWHYFDRIVVDDLTPQIRETHFKDAINSHLPGWLSAMVVVQSANAVDMLHFVSKIVVCPECGKQHIADTLHIDGGYDALLTDLKGALVANSNIELGRATNKYQTVTFKSRRFSIVEVLQISRDWLASRDEAATHEAIVSDLVRNGVYEVSSDLFVAAQCRTALMASTPFEGFVLNYGASVEGNLANKIAFAIPLPIIDRVPLRELYSIRGAFGDAFHLYKARIREAIHERIKTVEDPNPDKIAREIYRDVIEREFLRLRGSLRASKDSLIKSFGAATVSSVACIAGLLTHDYPVAGAGLAGAATLTSSAITNYKQRKELANSDMFFLFKAAGHADS